MKTISSELINRSRASAGLIQILGPAAISTMGEGQFRTRRFDLSRSPVVSHEPMRTTNTLSATSGASFFTKKKPGSLPLREKKKYGVPGPDSRARHCRCFHAEVSR